MALAPDLVGTRSAPVELSWTHDDVLLYALAVGAGQYDPTAELAFTTENTAGTTPAVLPTFANILTRGAQVELGDIDRTRLVHAEQAFTLPAPLPVHGRARTTAEVTSVLDKGRGALVRTEATAVDADTGAVLATIAQTVYIAGEGGFGGSRGESVPSAVPDREPDEVLAVRTRPEQALLYRLTGDRNPLHTDPAFAARGGFAAPILHGMCTYGCVGRVLLHAVCDGDVRRVAGMAARFTRPVLPGDELAVALWRDGPVVHFRTTRDGEPVLDRGRLDLARAEKETADMGALDGRTAIVTGGARGIGAAISRRFAAEGAAVVVNDLGSGPDGVGSDAGAAEELVAEIRAAGGRAVADGGDVADSATGQRLVDTAVAEFGGLDVLVNSAGVLRDRMIFNMSDDEWDTVIRVHLRGHFTTCRAAAAHFHAQRNPGGHYRIVNFTSHSGLEGSPGQANYAAAKMGVIGLTYSLAQGLARYGVTANAIAPAAATRLVETVPQEDKAIQDRPDDDDPSRSPDNVAALAVYLAGERSDWLTGRVLGSVGFSVSVYANPTVVGEVASDGPWSVDDMAARLESALRPHANGLPPSLFADQAARRG